jgi:uncharacterized coiled-coil protein SlyX
VFNHHWTEDIQDVVSLGWLVGCNPKIAGHSDSVVARLRSLISLKGEVEDNSIPIFVCAATNVSVHYNHKYIGCHAFEIQCRRQHTRILMPLLKKTFLGSGTLTLYSTKHLQTKAYVQAIQYQKQYLSASRCVTITGVPPALMPEFAEVLMAHAPSIVAVWPTKQSSTTGRYLLETNRHFLPQVARSISQDIGSLYDNFLDVSSTLHDGNFPWPSLTSRIPLDPTSSDGSTANGADASVDSWHSQFSDFYSHLTGDSVFDFDGDESLGIPDPPPPVRPAAGQPTMSYVEAVQQSQPTQWSDLTSANQRLEEMEKKNAILEKQLQRLEATNAKQLEQMELTNAKLSALLQSQCSTTVSSASSSTPAAQSTTLPNVSSALLEALVTQLVPMLAKHLHQAKSPPRSDIPVLGGSMPHSLSEGEWITPSRQRPSKRLCDKKKTPPHQPVQSSPGVHQSNLSSVERNLLLEYMKDDDDNEDPDL